MQKLATVSGLYIYPIKSCSGISVDKAIVTKYGLASAENPAVIDRYFKFCLLAVFIINKIIL